MGHFMDLSALSDFQLVATAGSLGKASRDSGRPKATLSRRIRALEESLGVRLVERGRHALRLTAEGQALYERTHDLVRDIEEAGRSLADGNRLPRGLLRISAPALFSHAFGGRLAAEFTARHPDVHVHWTANDRPVDLVEEGYDLVIRVNPPADSELVGRRFARDAMELVAPASLPLPPPTAPSAHVPAVAMVRFAGIERWRFEHDGNPCELVPDHRVVLSSLTLAHAAVRAGAGAALLPRSLVRADIASGQLVLWGHYPERTADIWVLHSSRRLVSPKVTAFAAFLVECFP